ncbi:MAG: hypothetical protein AAGF96_05885 [Bacteroidota bacterium]
MSSLTSGRRTPCKSQAGLRKMYLYSHMQYPIQVLQGLKSGILTSHPTTQLFEYQGEGKGVRQTKEGKGYRQEARITLPIIGNATNQTVLQLLRMRVGLISEDRNGRNWVYGIENGLDVEARLVTGQNREELNGYQLTFTGMEEYEAPFVSNLTVAGFRMTDNPLVLGCLLSSSGLPSSIGFKVSDCSVPQSL